MKQESGLNPLWPRHDIGASPAKVFQFLIKHEMIDQEVLIVDTHDGLIHGDLVPAEVGGGGRHVLPSLPGVEHSV